MNEIQEEEDPLAILRALRSTHNILPQELQDIGAETLEEAIEKSRAKAAANVSANASVTVTVLESPSSLSAAAPPSRISATTTTSTALPFVPIPLGGPRSAEHIALLYQLCQKRAIQPEFVFEQRGARHQASLILGNVLLHSEDGRTYSTKKEAKEVLAKKGVELVKQWDEEDKKKQEELDLRSSEDGNGEDGITSPGQAEPKAMKDAEPQENWVGMLLGAHSILLSSDCNTHRALTHYCRIYTSSFPSRAELPTVPTQHTCLCLHSHPQKSLYPSIPTSFGSPTTPFASKRAAKAASARDAVRWLRSAGHLGAPGTSPPRKKARHSLDTLINGITTNSNHDTASTIDGSTTAPTLEFPTTATAAQQVHTLSHYLGLQSPEYRFSVDPDENFLYNGAAWFVDATGALAGPLGMVEGVFGKKAAKEECAKEVVKVLRAEIARRGRLTGAWVDDF